MTTVTPELQNLIDTVPLREGADIITRTIAYEHDGESLEGFVTYDAALAGPLPTVAIVHDWNGLSPTAHARAEMFARLGYAAFAIDMFGVGNQPANPEEAQAAVGRFYGDMALMRSRVAAGFDQAIALDIVDADRMAALGYCFGGSTALELARTGAAARGFASFHGGLMTHDGEGLDSIRGSLLVMTGAADPVVPDAAVTAFQDELRMRPDLDWQVISYAGAPHAFTVPGPNYRATADRRSWREIEGFLSEVLA